MKTVEKAENKSYLFTEKHTFYGAAVGTSFENGKPYIQLKVGNAVELACGY